jgi:hypothetical protein
MQKLRPRTATSAGPWEKKDSNSWWFDFLPRGATQVKSYQRNELKAQLAALSNNGAGIRDPGMQPKSNPGVDLWPIVPLSSFSFLVSLHENDMKR